LELAIITYAILLPFIFIGLVLHFGQWISPSFMAMIIFGLSFVSGALIGGEFPLANQIYLKSSLSLGKSVGIIYASDLLGGWLAGIVGGVVLLPILGLLETCIFVVIMKLSSFIIIFTMNLGQTRGLSFIQK